MSMYMVFNSDKHSTYYPGNKHSNFIVNLLTPLQLNGSWMVALIDFKTSVPSLLHKTLYLYSDLCGDTMVDGVMQPLLRRFWCDVNNGDYSMPIIDRQYKPVMKNVINNIQFYIRDADGQLASFIDQPVSITLHLKAHPFYI